MYSSFSKHVVKAGILFTGTLIFIHAHPSPQIDNLHKLECLWYTLILKATVTSQYMQLEIIYSGHTM